MARHTGGFALSDECPLCLEMASGIEGGERSRCGPQTGMAWRVVRASQSNGKCATTDTHLCGRDAGLLLPLVGAGALLER